jgi:hypothetical protein
VQLNALIMGGRLRSPDSVVVSGMLCFLKSYNNATAKNKHHDVSTLAILLMDQGQRVNEKGKTVNV